MSEKYNRSNLFTDQHCISAEGIRRYISGELDPEELRLIQSHARECALCSEALEGAMEFSHENDFNSGLDHLNKKWERGHSRERGVSRATLAGIASIAASLVLLIGVHLTIQYQRSVRSGHIAAQMDGGYSLHEALAATDIQIIPGTADSPSVRETQLRKKYLKNSENQVFPATMLEETRIYAFAGSASDDRIAGNVSEESGSVPKGRLNYPIKAIPIRTSKIPSQSGTTAQGPAQLAMQSEMPEIDRASLNNFQSYIRRNLHYPRSAIENKIGGKVYVQFAINTRGKLTDIQIINPGNTMLDSELIRVLESSPDWQPGMLQGKKVELALVMPVEFHLNE